MAKVLFVNPVVRAEDDPRHVPYGIALLAAIASKAGHQVQVFDGNAWRFPTDEPLIEALQADTWDVVATGGITTTYAYVKKAVHYAAQYAPQATVVVGGGVFTSMPHDILQFLPQVHVGVVGESFLTFPEILRMAERPPERRDWSEMLGIAWRDREGQIQLNLPRPLLQEIDSLPYPAWELFPLEIYFRNSSVLLSEEAMQAKRRLDICGSYGCSLICRFCFHLGLSGDLQMVETPDGRQVVFTQDRELRWHSPHYIVGMVKYMHQRFGIDFVAWLDENLMTMDVASRRNWMTQICDLWIKEGLQPRCVREGRPHSPDICDGVHWGGTSHATLCTPLVLKKMHEAGCTYLDYGLESFSSRILKNVGKGATPDTNRRAIKITLDAGIRPIPNQIIGFPDEFFDSIRDSVHAWEELGIQVVPFFATPYPGSEWYFKYKDRIVEQYDGDLEAFLLDLGDATKITAVICENFNAVELLGLRELMVHRDLKRINEYEKIWRQLHGEPKFSDVRWPGAAPRKKRQVGQSPEALGLSQTAARLLS